jgi:hypothetical protein
VLGELKDVAHPGMLFGRQTPASTGRITRKKNEEKQGGKKNKY